MRTFIQSTIILLSISLLSGCMNVATTGASAVYNHRSLQKNLHDQYLSAQTYRAINYKTTEFKNANIAIAVYNGEILLAGQVPEPWQRQKAEDIAKSMPDVERVYNQLKIANPASTLTHMSDAWITSKVKAQLIASEELDASQIKVVTENGVVYLMGVLQPSEASAAIDIARNTDGVSAVVKIFTYMRMSKA